MIDDVAAVLGRDLTEAELGRAVRLIELAEGLIESALPGFTVEPGSETVDVDPGDPDVVWTPRYPVTAVNSINDNTDSTLFRWNQKGRIRFTSSTLTRLDLDPLATSAATVDYDYGLDPLPADVALTRAAMVAAVIRRQAANPDNVLNENLGAYGVGYGTAEQAAARVGMEFPDGALRRWKRTTQVSVPLSR